MLYSAINSKEKGNPILAIGNSTIGKCILKVRVSMLPTSEAGKNAFAYGHWYTSSTVEEITFDMRSEEALSAALDDIASGTSKFVRIGDSAFLRELVLGTWRVPA